MTTGKWVFWVLILCLSVSVVVLAYAYSRPVKNPEDVALEFIAGSPTFKWDGVEDSLKVVETVRVGEDEWVVRVEFVCTHSGYGDRTGMVVLPVLTRHTAEVKVVKGIVVEAVIDGVWDELGQKPLPENAC